MDIGIIDISRGRAVRAARVTHADTANSSSPTPTAKFLPSDMLAAARDHADWNEEVGRDGTALLIRTLVADIENYRDAFKGATVVTNEASRSLAFAQLKLSTLFLVTQKVQAFLAEEIERAEKAGNTRECARLIPLSDDINAALNLVTR